MGSVDVYIAGSNSDFLSSDLNIRISERHVEIRVFPLSLKEFMDLHGYPDRGTVFDNYLLYGGLSVVDPSGGLRHIMDYLGGVYSTIVIKDVARRFKAVSFAEVDVI